MIEILKILAEKVSKKASVISMAMILVYLLGTGTAINSLSLCVIIIAFLSLSFTLIQAYMDYKFKEIKIENKEKNKKEIIESVSEEAKESEIEEV